MSLELDKQLYDAISDENEALALQLLDQGADPLSTHFSPVFSSVSIFERAVPIGSTRMFSDKVMLAMLARLTQEQKNELLADYVWKGKTTLVSILLADGADANQKINGRSLIQRAPNHAVEVKRMLRAAKTGEAIESAMRSEDTQQHARAPSNSPTL